MSYTILVIDDEPEFVKMVESRLKANGYEVICAFDGQEGINKAKSLMPDLILIDIMMPNLGGGDAVRLLKDDSQTSNIPVVFLTAVLNKSDEEHDQKVNIGNKFYPAIAKPFDPNKLINKIKSMLHE